MKIKSYSSTLCRSAKLIAFGLLFSHTAISQEVSIDLTHDPRTGSDWFIGTDGVYTSGPNIGQSFFEGSAQLFCFNRNAFNPDGDGEANPFEVVGAVDLFNLPGAATRGEALVHWIFDNYYATGAYTTIGTASIQGALWEIDRDYDGTVGSLSLDPDAPIAGVNTYPAAYRSIVDDMVANYGSIASDYRSDIYQITFLRNANPDRVIQDFVMLLPIPEPGSAALVGLAGVAALFRRRRSR